MEINRIYNIDFLNNKLPDKCASLIIADTPYFEVKGGFDFICDSFEEYLQDVEKEILCHALEQAKWNKTLAAKQLGISFRSLRYRLQKLGLDDEQ